MSFAAEYLARIEAFAALGAPPRVRALHLPPAMPVEERNANQGEFCALELEDGSLGLLWFTEWLSVYGPGLHLGQKVAICLPGKRFPKWPNGS